MSMENTCQDPIHIVQTHLKRAGVEDVRSIGSSNDVNSRTTLHAIHLGQELVHNPVMTQNLVTNLSQLAVQDALIVQASYTQIS